MMVDFGCARNDEVKIEVFMTLFYMIACIFCISSMKIMRFYKFTFTFIYCFDKNG